MDIKLIDKIIDSLNMNKGKFDDLMPYFSDKRYKPCIFDKKNFHEIKDAKINKKIAFVDGGNLEIIKNANYSIQLVRVYYTIYLNNKRVKSKRYQFFVLVNTITNKNKINYRAQIFDNELGIDENHLIFDLYDETLREGIHKANISRIGEVARRFAELKAAELLINELDAGDIIVRDGSLQSSVTNEKIYFNKLYKKALEKNIIIAGLSKSSTLLTDKGNSLISTLSKMADKDEWYYYPVAKIEHPDHEAEMFFIKLNEKSRHVFRFEVYKKNKFDIDEILTLLKINQDPVFLGYPYGLIEADKFARVTNNEKEYLKTILSLKRIEEKEAHEILDSIS